MANRYVLFYIERRTDGGGLARTWGARYDCQALPAGAVVVGLGVAGPAGLRELADPGYMTPAEEAEYEGVLVEAQAVTDEALMEADRLEEDGLWEEAAVLRLRREGGARYEVGTGEVWAEVWAGELGLRVQVERGGAWYEVGTGEVWAEVWAGELGLRVQVERDRTTGRGRYWFWSPGGWSSTPYPHSGVRTAAEQCPPEVRRAVEEAVRQALERRFGGGT